MPTYVLVQVDGMGMLYQRADSGQVTGYYDASGALVFEAIPSGIGSEIMDADPAVLEWMSNA